MLSIYTTVQNLQLLGKKWLSYGQFPNFQKKMTDWLISWNLKALLFMFIDSKSYHFSEWLVLSYAEKITHSVIPDAPVYISSILWFGGRFFFGGHFVFQNFIKICSDCPYELQCKISSLLLKKWASYGTWYERGQTSIYHLYSSDYTVETSFLLFLKKKPKKKNFRTSYEYFVLVFMWHI